MFKSLLVLVIGLSGFSAHAQSAREDGPKDYSEIRLVGGGKGLATELGLEFEDRKGPVGLSAFAMFSKKREAQNLLTGSPEQWVVGMGVPLHLPSGPSFDMYITPGAAVIFQKEVQPDNKDVFTFGPALKIGTQYLITPNWSAGVEFVTIANWFSDKIVSSQNSANAMLGFRF